MNTEELKSMELNENELGNVNGGTGKNDSKTTETGNESQKCPICKKGILQLFSGGRMVCQNCGYKKMG